MKEQHSGVSQMEQSLECPIGYCKQKQRPPWSSTICVSERSKDRGTAEQGGFARADVK